MLSVRPRELRLAIQHHEAAMMTISEDLILSSREHLELVLPNTYCVSVYLFYNH